MSLKLNSSGGGSVTLQEPVTASDLTVNLPATLGNTGNSMVVTSDASGNVGIGVVPSAWASGNRFIDVNASASFGAFGSSDSMTLANAYWNGSNWIRKNANNAWRMVMESASGAPSWTFQYAGNSTAGSTISWSEAMRIDSSGNMGIGTSSPSGKLHLNNASALTTYMYMSNSFGSALIGMGGANQLDISQNTGGPIIFYTGGERARIDSSGNLLVGTTSVQNDAQVSVLTKNESTSGMSIYVTRSSSGFTGLVVDRRNSDGQVATWLRGGTAVGNVSVTGSATAYNTSSDYRLKHDIAPMNGALAKVQQLKPVTYKWNVDGSDGEGFIAHELAEVCPDAVTGAKDAVDADGKPVYQGIDTSFLVATLTAAIQELKAELDTVKAELAVLKGTA